MAFQKGNKLAANPKPWTRALERAIAQDPDKLRRIALKTLDMAEAGDQHARKEIGERLDGKALQQIEHSGSIDRQTAQGMTDDELAAIAAGSSAGAVEQAPSTETLN